VVALTPPEPDSRLGPVARLALMFLALYAFVGVFLVMPRMTADGVAYYAQTRSIILDGDGDIADEYRFDERLVSPLSVPGPREWLPRDYDERFRHYANVGIIVLFAPFVALGHAISVGLDAAGVSVSADGYDAPYILGVAYGTSALIACGLLMATGAVQRTVGTLAAFVGAVAAWLGTSLVYMGSFRPFHTHGPAVVLEGGVVGLFLLRARDRKRASDWILLGALVGLLIAVRPIGAMYAVVPALFLLWSVAVPTVVALGGRVGVRGVVRAAIDPAGRAMLLGVLFLAGMSLGRLAPIVFAGDFSLTGSSYYEDSGYLADTGGDPIGGLLSLVFDARQGILWVVPGVLVGIVGLAGFLRRDPLVAIAGWIWVSSIWLFIATLGYPERFGGLNYASRHLIEATPIYAIGIAGAIVGCAALGRAIGDRIGGRSRIGRRVGLGLAVAVVAATTIYGLVQHLAAHVISGAGTIAPLERLRAILANPRALGRLFLDTSDGDPAEGRVYLGGRIVAAIVGPQAAVIRELVLAAGLLVVIGVVSIVLAAAALRRWRTPSEGTSTDWTWAMGVLAWAATGVIVAAVALPAILPPSRTDASSTTIRAAWTDGAAAPTDGTVGEIVIGSSPFGNAVLSPIPPVAAVDGPEPDVGATSVTALVSGASGIVELPDEWRSLGSVVLELDGRIDPALVLDVAIRRPGSLVDAVTSRVVGSSLAAGPNEIPLPLRLPDGADRRLSVYLIVVEGTPPAILVDSDSRPVIRPRGVDAKLPVSVTIEGEPLIAGGWQAMPLPQDTSLRIAPDGRARMRGGPWAPQTMLREAIAGDGWFIPGPTLVPGTWSDTALERPESGTPLVFRVETPWPYGWALIHAVGQDQDPASPAQLTVEASADGRAWQVIATQDLTGRSQHHVTGRIDGRGSATVWFRVEVTSDDGTAGLNGVWFDIDLGTAPIMPAGADAGSVAIGPAADGQPGAPFRIDIDRLASPLERVALQAAALGRDAAAAIPAGVSLLSGLGLLGLVLVLLARGTVAAGIGLGAVAVVLLLLGTLALPRVSVLGRTQPYTAGTASAVEVAERSATALAAGGEYVSPVFSIQPGSVVTGGEADVVGGAARLDIRLVEADGRAGPWIPVAPDLQLGTGSSEGVQVRVTFASAGDRLIGLRLRTQPPLGRGGLLAQESGYPRIGDDR
jgi:hypothetical protein